MTAPHGLATPALLLDLPADVVEDGARWLHQQCWLWGRDLQSPGGNLLVTHGLRRLGPAEAPRSGHRTRFGMTTPDGAHVVVWSGGYCFADADGVLCFPRLRFRPVLLRPGAVAPDDVPVILAPPEAHGVVPAGHPAYGRVAPALEWLAAYEADVARSVPGYRAACAAEWDRIEREAERLAAGEGVAYRPLPGVPAEGLAASWHDLTRRVREAG